MVCTRSCYYDNKGMLCSRIICGYDAKEIESFGKANYLEWNY